MEDLSEEVVSVAMMSEHQGWEYTKKHINSLLKEIERDLLERQELELVERVALQKQRKSLLGVLNFVQRKTDKVKKSRR